jgi:AraC-like DNA-binding protein
MTIEGESGAPFRSRIVQTKVGGLTLSAVRAGRHLSSRSRESAMKCGDGMTYVSVPRVGQLRGRQVSTEVTQRHGSLSMLLGSEPVDLAADSEFRQLVIGAPTELIVPRLAAPQGVAVATGGLCGLAATTARYLFASSARFSRADGARASFHLTSLLVSAFGSMPGATPPQVILQAAMDEAERRLADRTLSAAVLADRVHVSRRTLEKLFAERGTTVSRWLLERRLELSRLELMAGEPAGRSVDAIAQRCGFADRTHFSRVFRARFGVPPSQLRRAVAAGTTV